MKNKFTSLLLLVLMFAAISVAAFPALAFADRSISTWRDSNFKAVSTKGIESQNRFVAISPFEFADTKNGGSKYKTSATQNDFFGDKTGDAFENGWYWYWPGGDENALKRQGNDCVGALAVWSRNGGFGSNDPDKPELHLFLVQPTPSRDGQTCVVPGSSDVRGKGSDPNNSNEYELRSNITAMGYAATLFYWQNSNQIGVYDSKNKLTPAEEGFAKTFKSQVKKAGGGNGDNLDYFYSKSCRDAQDRVQVFVTVDKTNRGNSQIYHIRGNDVKAEWDGHQLQCLFGRNIIVSPHGAILIDGDNDTAALKLAYPERSTAAPTPGAGAQADPTDPAGDAQSCESEGGTLAWIFCPMLEFIDKQIAALDNAINNLLEVPPDDFADGSPLHEAWKVIRSLAYVILVPIMLVMVIGTALGIEVFSAYTVKKAFPRLVAAVLFIALSWDLTTFLVQLTNDFGGGILGLITSPFSNIPTSLADVIASGGGALGAGAVAGATTLAALALGPALLGILLLYGLSALLALFVGIMVLTLRQVVLLFLLLAAPIAILAWIFPGNDKPWKLWWSSFSKLLLMYPLIIALIAMGRVFAGVTSVSSTGGIIEFLIKLIAYIGPYFFIPATFKFAGGAFATIAGMANDKGKGLFDRSKAARGKLAGEAMRDFKGGTAGRRYNPRRMASMTVGRGLASGWKGRYGMGKVGAAARANQSNAEPDEIAKENLNFAREQVDEEVMAAVAMGNDVKKMMQLQHFKDKGEAHAIAVANRGKAVGSTRRTQVAAAKRLAQSGKIIANADEANMLYESTSGGDVGLRGAMKGNLQYTWRGVGRNDLGRDNTTESLKEMSMAEIGRLKPLGAKGLFGDSQKLSAALTDPKLTPAQRDHVAGLLVSAGKSPYVNADQQGEIQAALDHIRTQGPLNPNPDQPDALRDAKVAIERAQARAMRETEEDRRGMGLGGEEEH